MRRVVLQVFGILTLGVIAGCAPGPTAPPAVSSPPKTIVPPSQIEVPEVPAVDPVAKSSASKAAHEDPILAEVAPEEPDEEPIVAEVEEEPFVVEEGFLPLSLADFETFAAEPDTWTEDAGVIRCTGKPRGYLRSQAGHQNFTWRLEYRFDRPKSLKDEAKFKGNTGFLVYLNGENKIDKGKLLWPVCLEVQGKHMQMAAIKENGGAAPVTVQDDEAAREAARKPVGEWNRLEIVSRDGALTVNLNDVPISRSEPNFLSEGAIGIQAEDHPFAVRRMRIKDE